MAFAPKTPMKVIVALVNFSFIGLALTQQDPLFTWLAAAVWGLHALMAVAGVGIAGKAGLPAGAWGLQIALVGTISLLHLRALTAGGPPAAGR